MTAFKAGLIMLALSTVAALGGIVIAGTSRTASWVLVVAAKVAAEFRADNDKGL